MTGTDDSSVQTQISFCPQYQKKDGKVICYPGSVFEGTVKVTLETAMPVERIKLVFKGTERVNYNAMGWEKSKNDKGRLFAISTVLFGFPTDIKVPAEERPVLEAGEHLYPFVCQMPVINFPPNFEYYMIATTYSLFVAIETKHTILSKPYFLEFQPIVETMPTKDVRCLTEQTQLTRSIVAQVSVPQLEYNINDKPLTLPITVQLMSEGNLAGISCLTACIKRYCRIDYRSYSKDETNTIASHSISTLSSKHIILPLSVPSLQPTLAFSNYLSIEYKLEVTVKVRHGPICLRKKVYQTPIVFGTLPLGLKAPRQLEEYSHLIDNKPDIFSKPCFLKPEVISEYLPAYNDEPIPPIYPVYHSIQT